MILEQLMHPMFESTAHLVTRSLVLTGAVMVVAACSPDRLDENLCPIDHPILRSTVLLLDTSDPLSPKHHEELKRIIRDLQSAESTAEDFRVASGEALIVYELRQELDALKPVIEVCNPGDHPQNWGWQDELTKGKQIALHHWQRFNDGVQPLFEKTTPDVTQPRSPIIETLGVIVPRHAPSKRTLNVDDGKQTHIILFSDLLQHTDALSHYGNYPPADQIRKTDGLRALQTDLTGVDVSLVRLERPQPNGRWQTRDHYYWWTELIRSFGGAVVYQDSI